MPEEVNRILCDHVSTLLFSPTKSGYDNLRSEGFKVEINKKASLDNPNIYHCGDVMYDNSLYFSKISDNQSKIINELSLKNEKFILATVHRNDNTDSSKKLNNLFDTFLKIIDKYQIPIVIPIHPRTAKMMDKLLHVNTKKQLKNLIYLKLFRLQGF